MEVCWSRDEGKNKLGHLPVEHKDSYDEDRRHNVSQNPHETVLLWGLREGGQTGWGVERERG